MHHLRRSLSDLTSADGYVSSVRRVGLHENGLSTDPCVHKRTSEERQVHSKTSVQYQAKNEQSTNAFEAVSFSCLSSDNRFRRVIISLVRWRWFERIAILVIMLNCIMLAMYDPLDRACSTFRCQTLEFLEPFVFTFFALEMLVKMIAMGVWGGRSYFADAWNIMDFLIVITGLVDVLGIRGSYLMIARMGRILRPLRAINRVPSIRILVSLLMDTIPMLGNVLLLAFLVFSVFGIIGVQMFQGKLRNRCYPDNNFNSSYLNSSAERLFATPFFVPVLSTDFLCHLKGDHGTQSCDEVPKWFGNAECTHGYGVNASFDNRTNSTCLDMNRRFRTCKPDGPNPYYGSVSFDDIALAWVFIYQVVTLEGWSDLMYLIQDAYSFWTWIYFVVLISIGSFFLVNLALVVIMMQFSETKRREIKLMREHKKMAVTASQLSLYSDLRNVWVYLRQLLYCAKRTEHVHHIHQHQHVHVHQHMFQCEQCKKMSVVSSPPDSATIPNIEISCFEEENPCSPLYTRRRSLSCPSMLTIGSHHGNVGHCSPGNDQQDKAHATLSATSSVDSAMAIGRPYLRPVESYQSKAKSGLPNTICVQAEAISAVSIKCPKKASISSRTSISLRINSAAGEVNTNATCTANSDAGGNTKTKMSTTTRFNIPPRKASNISLSSVSTDYDFNSDLMDGSMFDLSHSDKYYISQTPSHVQRFRLYCKNISESPRTALGVMVVIILNTVCMGIEHHNQPQTMTTVLEYFNLGFIWIFTLEMLIKMMSTGIKAYFKNGFNIFDSIVVLLSILEIVVGNGSGGNFIVLRSLRLLRIFKLVRPMRHQMVVMIRTMSSVLTFFSLLFLFMFTFAILGMNIFGGKFSFPNRMGVMIQPRSNFDSFLWSMITVFQILTQEDWNLVLYDGIRATNLWATVYFISLMTIGYYVLLNLLVAILVEGFTTPLDKGRMAERIAGLLRSKARKLSLMKRAVSLPDVLPLATEEEEETQQVDSKTFPRLVQRPLEARRCTLGVLQLSRKANLHSSLYEIPHVECQREKLKKNEPVLLSAKRTGFFGDKPALEMTARSPISDSDISQEFKIVDDSSALLHCFPCAKRRRHWSLYLFHPKSKTRLMMKKICSSKWFDYFILVLIIYSCVLLGIETPELLDRSGLVSKTSVSHILQYLIRVSSL